LVFACHFDPQPGLLHLKEVKKRDLDWKVPDVGGFKCGF